MTRPTAPGPLPERRTAGPFQSLAEGLRLRTAGGPGEGNWPEAGWNWLRETGVLRWAIPEEFGGLATPPREFLQGYIALSSACLTTAFVLTQRNGACQRIAQSPNRGAQTEWLPPLARGELFATVGISHLTTSRQHLATPAVRAEPVADGFELTGEIPWVTGAPQADLIVTGGVLADGRQLLAVVDTRSTGVAVGEPAPLLALTGSQTAPVRLEGVRVPSSGVLQSPVENVMRQGAGVSTGSLSTSALAVGHSGNILAELELLARQRPELQEFASLLRRDVDALEQDLLQQVDNESCAVPGSSTESLRVRANSLVLRSAQVLLAATKGAGYITGSFAERALREAMFFLVWSCPTPVVIANLRELTTTSPT